jgi:mannose-6-phosphate isomerase-like protein (cupin superfamily)
MSERNGPKYVAAGTGPAFWGPGDRYTFLVTGAQSDGAYFIFEAIVPPGAGPPPHIHRREQETYYLLEGTLDIIVGEKRLKASKGDFVHTPPGTVHTFRNAGNVPARMLVVCSPAGLEKYFEEVLEPVQDRSASPPAISDALIARLLAAAPKYGLEFV